LRDPAVAAHLATQKEEVARFMKAPFEPELTESSVAAVKEGQEGRQEREPLRYRAGAGPNVSARGKEIFEQQGCNACHGDGGVGSPAGPKLIGVSAKYDEQKLEAILRTPTSAMTLGGMQPTDLKGPDMKALIAYLESLQ
jgi:mono/diheme cytochrome c family protein